MFSLLVVDDEPRQVKALASIIRQLKPHYQISGALDGEDALEILQNNSLDIVISDVRMPGIDGIALTGLISRMEAPPKVILLTGFDEFQFAVQALRYRAFDYLLKPIGKSELIDLLERLEATLLEERNEKQRMATIQKKLTSSLPVYEDHLLNLWIEEQANDQELEEINDRFFGSDGSGLILVSELNGMVSSGEEASVKEASSSLAMFRDMMLRQLGEFGNIHAVFQSENDSHSLVAAVSLPSKSVQNFRQLELRMDNLISEFHSETGVDVTISIGPEVERFMECAPFSYKQAKMALKQRFYAGVRKVISNALAPAFNTRFPFKEEFAFISNAMHNQDRFNLSRAVNDHIDKLKLQQCDPDLLREEWYVFMLHLAKAVRNHFHDEEFARWLAETKIRLYSCRDYFELKKVLLQFLVKIMEVEERQSKNQHQQIIDQCIRYLSNHYQEDLSLEDISQKFHFHPSYFSTIFKSVAGIGFSEYMQRVRIDRAKQLILKTDYKMADIAIKVGYRDAAYFTKIFKKETGTSPYKYKRIHAQNSNAYEASFSNEKL
ncbi:response regulator [Paenibacillus sedimenti]|uniref:Response regulator n=1 Tax=Paenibacillus sedimenti TaxID=2770274 RepID=A0A926KP99_9BACL|nr:response regulator [Paenibacillus sedimenti]MBD0381512.1 response regulator [Paenibacillus sedimenti]